MQPEIRTIPVEYTIWGHSLRHDPAKRFGDEILALLGRVWPVIKAGGIPNDGINRVVYDKDESGACVVFAGVVLAEGAGGAGEFERKTVRLTRYAYWKHVGPYRLVPATGEAMTKALNGRGLRTGWPMVEVYGHWSEDESTLETETFVAVE
jgi:predicted transcriptional regulator YdeE